MISFRLGGKKGCFVHTSAIEVILKRKISPLSKNFSFTATTTTTKKSRSIQSRRCLSSSYDRRSDRHEEEEIKWRALAKTTTTPNKILSKHKPDNVCRVVFAGPHFHAALPVTKDELKKRGSLFTTDEDDPNTHNKIQIIHAPTRQDLFNVLPTADIAVPFMERFDSNIFDTTLSPNLKLVMQYGVGLEGVDIEAATKAGVMISNIPACITGNAVATAEHGLFLTFCMLRQLNDLQRRFQSQELGGLPIPQTIHNKHVTVIGYGAVGSVLCHYLQTLGANVTAVRRTWNNSSSPPPDGIECLDSSDLHVALPSTDVLILACPLTSETKFLINQQTIKLLPSHACVINIGRGPLVEYTAMLDALNTNQLGGYASDVGIGGRKGIPSEPFDPNNELSKHPKTVFTPHIGGYADYSYEKMAIALVDAIECIQQGKAPPVWINQPKK